MEIFESLRRLHRALAARVSRLLLPPCLCAAYFLGLGLTWIAVRLFKPELLAPENLGAASFWKKTEGYEPDRQECLRQS